MKALDRPFTKIINGTMQFVIPVFQRDYSWTESQCEQLWNDIIQVSHDKTERGHFLGSVVYVATGDTSAGFTRWLLIDGQQRVTTLTLLLTALRDHILETQWIGDEDSPTPKRIDAYFLKNLQEEGAREHKLVLRRHDRETLQRILDGNDPPKESSERIRENYDFFREQLKTASPADVYRGIGRLIVVDVTLDRGTDDPQLIFESLNSTGVDLNQSDLIRNFILMRLPEKEQTRLYNSYWSKIETLFKGSEKTFDAFVRDYLALKMRASKQEKAKEIYRAFRNNFHDLCQDAGDLEALLVEMVTNAEYYSAFATGRSINQNLAPLLSRLRKLSEAPAILIIRLFECFSKEKTLSLNDFKSSILTIESYVFRRAICGLASKSYWQTFANTAYRLDPTQPLQSLKVALARQSDRNRFPNDEEFLRELKHKDLYGLRVCHYLLDRLENYNSKEPTDTSSYSIEHILPQNEKLSKPWREMLGKDWKEIQDEFLHRLGNLTLTGYNSTYSDHPFEVKKEIEGGFAESSVRLNKYVREQEQWTDVEINKRGSLLGKKCLKVWPPLQVATEVIEAAKEAELRERAAKQDLSKVPMSEKAHSLFQLLQKEIRELVPNVIELAEHKSVSYHAPTFFLEVLPRKRRLVLLFPLEHNEVDDPNEVTRDESDRVFFFYASYEGGVSVRIHKPEDIRTAIPIIRQSISLANA
jgi:uncharacterized protein with ParB-like and HNH nuclease domain/predicted transport protein